MADGRVLIIEDETSAREALGCLLADDGYTVQTAATGRAGLNQLLSFRPDTVVCDFALPDMDGLEVLRRTRAAGPPGVRFIVVTARCAEQAEVALRREADYFFDKPVDLAHLREVVGRH